MPGSRGSARSRNNNRSRVEARAAGGDYATNSGTINVQMARIREPSMSNGARHGFGSGRRRNNGFDNSRKGQRHCSQQETYVRGLLSQTVVPFVGRSLTREVQWNLCVDFSPPAKVSGGAGVEDGEGRGEGVERSCGRHDATLEGSDDMDVDEDEEEDDVCSCAPAEEGRCWPRKDDLIPVQRNGVLVYALPEY